ncbi:MAG: diguanylate cyclase domain-containing protein [Thermoleophilia bacterium]
MAAIALAYFAAAQLGLALAYGESTASAVWPPAGIALAALVVLGVRLWPGVLLGALVAEATSGVPLGSALGITAGNTLEAVIGSVLLLRVARLRASLDRVRDVVALSAVGAFSCAIGATGGFLSLWLGGAVPFAALWNVWSTWWLGDVGGVLIVAPFLLVLVAWRRVRPRRRDVAEALALLAALAGTCILAFSGSPGLEYLVFPVLIWAALRFQALGAASTSLIAAGVSVSFAANGVGPFAAGTAGAGVLSSQLFVTVMSLGGLMLAAVVAERATAVEALKDAHRKLEHQVRERTAALATANAHLLTLATHDGLTGLPNRVLFFDVLDRAVALARRRGWELAVLFLDVDGFKDTNDRLGHHAGDELLVEAALRLRQAVREGDTVARLGGDEFAILLAGSTSPADAAGAAQRVLTGLAQPLPGLPEGAALSASIGVAVRPADDDDGHELLKQADAAMYHAKAAGGGRFEFFEPAMSSGRARTPYLHVR